LAHQFFGGGGREGFPSLSPDKGIYSRQVKIGVISRRAAENAEKKKEYKNQASGYRSQAPETTITLGTGLRKREQIGIIETRARS